jgi:hypothetical protein
MCRADIESSSLDASSESLARRSTIQWSRSNIDRSVCDECSGRDDLVRRLRERELRIRCVDESCVLVSMLFVGSFAIVVDTGDEETTFRLKENFGFEADDTRRVSIDFSNAFTC